MRQIFSFLTILLFFVSCNSFSSKEWKVGVDPSWYPLHLKGKETQVTAFSTELLVAIGKEEQISLTKVTVNWDDLMQGLQEAEYDAILSSIPPYIFNQKQFDFSNPYLMLGPVLVVASSSKIEGMDDLKGKEIAVVTGSTDNQLLEKHEDVMIRYLDSIPDMLNAITSQEIDGALVDTLSAHAYLRDLYQGKIKIVTEPLTQEALRLIAKEGKALELIKKFNEGLKELKESGEYEKLQKKWGLATSS